MHTILILSGGFALLAVCLLVGKLVGGSRTAMVRAALIFLPLWLVGAGLNMWFGVAKAGYTMKEETPIFLILFAVPASVALIVWWKLKAR